MDDAAIAAALYGTPSIARDRDPAPVPEASEPPTTTSGSTAAVAAEAPAEPAAEAPAPVSPSTSDAAAVPDGDVTSEVTVAQVMLERRVRYLQILCGALVMLAAAALVVTAAPWRHFAAEPQLAAYSSPNGGVEQFVTDAADVTRSGRAEGALGPAAVLAAAAVAAAACASRRLWWASAAIAAIVFRGSWAHPPTSDLATSTTGIAMPSTSLGTAEWGVSAAMGIYWATLCVVLLATVAALVVRHSEHRLTRVSTGDSAAGGLREIISRYVVGGLARVGVTISDAVASERERRDTKP
jgi:hypothetical protein